MEQTGDMSFEQYGAPEELDRTMQAGNMDTQWHWHVAYRDSAKNMYRTSYQDHIHNRDVHVKSDFPAGYGGNNPVFRHDIRFKNSELYRIRKLACSDVSRDAKANFDANIQGVPGFCYNPRGAKKVPTLGQILKESPSGLTPPWAVTNNHQILNYRKAPPLTSSMRRTAHEHRLLSQTLPRSQSDATLGMGTMPPAAEPARAPAPALAASESMPALPTAAAEVVSPTKPVMSATMGSFGQQTVAPKKKMMESSQAAAYALNAPSK